MSLVITAPPPSRAWESEFPEKRARKYELSFRPEIGFICSFSFPWGMLVVGRIEEKFQHVKKLQIFPFYSPVDRGRFFVHFRVDSISHWTSQFSPIFLFFNFIGMLTCFSFLWHSFCELIWGPNPTTTILLTAFESIPMVYSWYFSGKQPLSNGRSGVEHFSFLSPSNIRLLKWLEECEPEYSCRYLHKQSRKTKRQTRHTMPHWFLQMLFIYVHLEIESIAIGPIAS